MEYKPCLAGCPQLPSSPRVRGVRHGRRTTAQLRAGRRGLAAPAGRCALRCVVCSRRLGRSARRASRHGRSAGLEGHCALSLLIPCQRTPLPQWPQQGLTRTTCTRAPAAHAHSCCRRRRIQP
ncbi:hypothetical protein HYPSUDRAFT_536689 [Hypholoma sublateritium FD-334 SS-4]|uniref:Uncharacterized protein n=1 Tax=Hypholoma sublateritium (strain FD-334 SS-4) TaxID=945553 RepID=A0A0D2P6G2_HYPSF|nr:hypothetical protein HYPSUDRAFT_536689 [Hypholoma sublateritium FD-334 SS-4]